MSRASPRKLGPFNLGPVKLAPINLRPITAKIILPAGYWLSTLLTRYLRTQRSFTQSESPAILLGGIGGLTPDILAFGSVCDWLGFHVPNAPIFSQLNLSDLMILFAAPVAAIYCPQTIWLRLICFFVAFTVIAANSYYHVTAFSHWITV